MQHYPKLRAIEFNPITHHGQPMWLLVDPLQLGERQLIFPPGLAQILLYCDGAHSMAQIQQRLSLDLNEIVPLDVIEDAVAQLDALYLLDNARSRKAIDELRQTYRQQAFRPPAYAGRGYAATPTALAKQFAGYSSADDALSAWPEWRGRGIVSPHIDYQRGGPVYAKVWQRAAAAVKEADLVLMFGTDHKGGPASLTLTRLPYATPYGVIPTDLSLVNALAETIGEEQAFALELNHMAEHAIELSAVWLHHMRAAHMCPMVPILCGSFYHFTPNGHPYQDENLIEFVETLKQLTAGKRVLAVASVDYSHVGPAFDHDYIMDGRRRALLRESDGRMRDAVLAGDAERFYREIAPSRNESNICGFSSLYLMLKYLEQTTGIEVAYEHCSADNEDHSLVSIGGMLLA
jgi:AmmeMemoRadiSam system protein B